MLPVKPLRGKTPLRGTRYNRIRLSGQRVAILPTLQNMSTGFMFRV